MTLVGRQTIYDRALKVHGYELLFRGENAHSGAAATGHVFLSAFADIGVNRVVADRTAYVNVTREYIIDQLPIPVPPGRVVLEILEDLEVDEKSIAGARRLVENGYRLALDDFDYHERWDPLLRLADVVKVDVLALGVEEAVRYPRKLARFDVKMLAEKVETRAEYETLRDAGYDYFQGFFLSRPEVLEGRRPAADQFATLRLLARLQDPAATMEEIDTLVSQNLPLTYRLLRYINSAAVGLPRKVDSIHKAIVYIGLGALKRWASLGLMAELDSNDSGLFHLALVRARLCEQVASAGRGGDPGSFFSVGLLSALEALLECPIAEAIAELPLTTEVKAALTSHAGPAGQALEAALSLEQCDAAVTVPDDFDATELGLLHVEAIDWAYQVQSGVDEPDLAA